MQLFCSTETYTLCFSDWPQNAVTTGFFFLEEALSAAQSDGSTGSDGGNADSSGCANGEGGSAELQQLKELKEWVSTHPRPVVVNFGSMACLDGGRLVSQSS